MSIDLTKNELEKLLLSLLKADVYKAKSAADLVKEIGIDALRRFSKNKGGIADNALEKQAQRRVLRILDGMVLQKDSQVLIKYGNSRSYYLKKQIDYSKLLQTLYGLDSSLAMRLSADEQQDMKQLAVRKLPDSVAEWHQKIFVGRSGVYFRARTDPKTISIIYDALETEKFVAFDYLNSKGQKKRIEVFPWGILLKGESCYLVANPYNSNKPLPVTYAMHRVAMPEITDRATFNHPSMPLDEQHFQRFCKERQIDLFANENDEDMTLQLHFYNGMGRSLYDTVLDVDQIIEELPNNERRLTAKLKNCFELHRFILGYGDDVEVEAPAELRALIAKKLKTALLRYENA
jgi:predicted DNA-binding transcriptional regulator YafY